MRSPSAARAPRDAWLISALGLAVDRIHDLALLRVDADLGALVLGDTHPVPLALFAAACKGPKKAMHDGRARAAKLDDPSAQAWAMRDAFDGLVEVIERKLGGR